MGGAHAMANFLNLVRLTRCFLLTFVRLNDGTVHVLQPVVMLVLHGAMVASAAGRSTMF
jgi:hypothetical protein